MSEPRKRKGKPTPDAPAPAVQAMPRGRVRIDPTIREQVASYIIASAAHLEREASVTPRTGSAPADMAFNRRRESYRLMMRGVETVLAAIADTVSLVGYDEAKEGVRRAMAAATAAALPNPDQRLPLPPVTPR